MHTADGLKPIEEIKVGDLVRTYDESGRKFLTGKVTELYRHNVKLLYKIILSDGSVLKTTWNHPFYVTRTGVERTANGEQRIGASLSAMLIIKNYTVKSERKGSWVEAKDLHRGNSLLNSRGNPASVVSVEPLPSPDITVYNFEVEGTHNYFAGEQGVLVHNYDMQKYFSNVFSVGVDEAQNRLKQAINNEKKGLGFFTDNELNYGKTEVGESLQYTALGPKTCFGTGFCVANTSGTVYLKEYDKDDKDTGFWDRQGLPNNHGHSPGADEKSDILDAASEKGKKIYGPARDFSVIGYGTDNQVFGSYLRIKIAGEEKEHLIAHLTHINKELIDKMDKPVKGGTVLGQANYLVGSTGGVHIHIGHLNENQSMKNSERLASFKMKSVKPLQPLINPPLLYRVMQNEDKMK